jgi:hypothetical protein
VSEGGAVKMEIFQEVSSVQDASLAAGLITNRRAIESNVLVDDGQIVVLGGLIQDSVEGDVSKVPLLGDIPGFGRLFRYDSRTRRKTNLLVFLRPIVIRDAGNAWDVTANRYDYIRSTSAGAQLPHLAPLPDLKMPEMQGLPPRPGTPGAPTPPRSPASLTPGLAEIFGSDRMPAPPPLPPSLARPQPDLPASMILPAAPCRVDPAGPPRPPSPAPCRVRRPAHRLLGRRTGQRPSSSPLAASFNRSAGRAATIDRKLPPFVGVIWAQTQAASKIESWQPYLLRGTSPTVSPVRIRCWSPASAVTPWKSGSEMRLR